MTLFDVDRKQARVSELEARMNEASFWDTPSAAQRVVGELKTIKTQIEPVLRASSELEEAVLAYEMAKESADKELLAEADERLFGLAGRMEKIELQSLLAGPHDHRNCFLNISAGDGGTEAHDWAEMLFRMYLNYCENMGFELEEVEKTPGADVGLNSVTLHVKGPFAFGYLKCERGTHRLARVSPFNAQGKRQTSFASVEVTPEFEETEIQIPPGDLEITPFVRASGPGGQNVNKVASAIRIVHKPTGIMVVSSAYRDQPQNKKAALAVLTAKLEQLAEEKREAELAQAKGGKLDRGWGTQIRSYVIYDNRVKDHRTGFEMMNPQGVLDGDLQGFIDAELKRRRAEQTRSESSGA